MKISPQNSKSVFDLQEIDFETENFWFSTLPTVIIISNKENPKFGLEIPKEDFDKMIEWYLKEQ